MRNSIKATLILISMLIWGLSYPLVKLLLNYGVPPITLATLRHIVFIPMLIIVILRKSYKNYSKEDLKLFLTLAFFTIFLPNISQNIGMLYTTASISSVIQSTSPVFTIILAFIFLKETKTINKIIGSLIALTGTILLSTRGSLSFDLNTFGNILILVSSISYAISGIILKKGLSKIPAFDLLCFETTFGFFMLLASNIFLEDMSMIFSFSIDAWGDGYSSKSYIFDGAERKLIGQSPIQKVPKTDHPVSGGIASLGYLYSRFTQALGLRRYSDEGKVEALAAFGKKDETLYEHMHRCIQPTEEGIQYDANALSPYFDLSFLQSQIERIGKENFAATIQALLEDIVVEYIDTLAKQYPDIEALCLSGGVSANIIMSLNLYERTRFKKIFVVPPMGDEGVAMGSALLKALDMGEDISWIRDLQMPYFGNRIEKKEIEHAIEIFRETISAQYIGDEWYNEAGISVAKKKIVAIVHGRMEFGPRALGNRSIIANPTDPNIKQTINLKVKKRPEYQPFCPSILEEERKRLFKESFKHKHMAIAFRVKEEFHDKIPSAIHIDGTARPQFVEESDNPAYYRMIKKVKEITGFGVVINTSFNLHGRTIVHTAEDAIRDFIDCNIDELYIEGYRIVKRQHD